MRKRKEIENSGERLELKQLEVLLDIRELILKELQPTKRKKNKTAIKNQNIN